MTLSFKKNVSEWQKIWSENRQKLACLQNPKFIVNGVRVNL